MYDVRDPLVVVWPAVEPVSPEDAKRHLRIDHGDDDPWLLETIRAARETVEAETGRALITQTLEAALDVAPGPLWELPRPPLVAVESIAFTGADGAETTVSALDYLVDTRSTPGAVALRVGRSWPAVTLARRNGVVVRYTAGYGTRPADVPAALRHAILLLVGHLYENREATVGAGAVMALPLGVDRLLGPYRVF